MPRLQETPLTRLLFRFYWIRNFLVSSRTTKKWGPFMEIVGIGTDIVECVRIGKMIQDHGELFIARVYTDREIRYCRERKNATEHFAGRWAAKEAILKCLGTGWRRGISWTDLEIRNNPEGAPSVFLGGAAKERGARVADCRYLHHPVALPRVCDGHRPRRAPRREPGLLGDLEDDLPGDLVGSADGDGPHFHLAFVKVLDRITLGQTGDGQSQRQEAHELAHLLLLAIG